MISIRLFVGLVVLALLPAHAIAGSVTLNTPMAGNNTFTVSGSYSLDSGYGLVGSITVYAFGDDGTYASDTTSPGADATFTKTFTLPAANYTIYALIQEATPASGCCQPVPISLTSPAVSALVTGQVKLVNPGVPTLTGNKTGVNQALVSGTYTQLNGFTQQGQGNFFIFPDLGGINSLSGGVNAAAGKFGPSGSNSGFPAGAYTAYVSLPYVSGMQKTTSTSVGFHITVTNQ